MRKLLYALPVALVLAGCGGQETAKEEAAEVKVDTTEVIRQAAQRYLVTAPDNWRVVPPSWVKEHLKDPNIYIVDVRPEHMYAEGHVPGAVNIPLKTLVNPENLQKLPKDKQIVLFCVSGHTASMANAILGMLGYNVLTSKGGFNKWKEEFPNDIEK